MSASSLREKIMWKWTANSTKADLDIFQEFPG
jgi:hypothetical protein